MFIGQYIYQLAGDVAKSIKYSIAIPVVQYLLFLIYLSIYLCISSFAKEVMFLLVLACIVKITSTEFCKDKWEP